MLARARANPNAQLPGSFHRDDAPPCPSKPCGDATADGVAQLAQVFAQQAAVAAAYSRDVSRAPPELQDNMIQDRWGMLLNLHEFSSTLVSMANPSNVRSGCSTPSTEAIFGSRDGSAVPEILQEAAAESSIERDNFGQLSPVSTTKDSTKERELKKKTVKKKRLSLTKVLSVITFTDAAELFECNKTSTHMFCWKLRDLIKTRIFASNYLVLKYDDIRRDEHTVGQWVRRMHGAVLKHLLDKWPETGISAKLSEAEYSAQPLQLGHGDSLIDVHAYEQQDLV